MTNFTTIYSTIFFGCIHVCGFGSTAQNGQRLVTMPSFILFFFETEKGSSPQENSSIKDIAMHADWSQIIKLTTTSSILDLLLEVHGSDHTLW